MKKYSLLALALILTASFACKPQAKNSSTTSNANTSATTGLAQGSNGDVLAEVDGTPIKESEVLNLIKPRIVRIENQLFDIKLDGLNDLIENKLLEKEAKKRNLTVAQLMKAEVEDKLGDVSQSEIDAFYASIKDRVGGKTVDELKPQITAQLKAKQANTFRNNLVDKLMNDAKVDIFLKKPKVEVSAGDSPVQGPDSAPVTIIEFTDFQCPFCERARPTLTKILEDYKTDVRYVLRNFPLDFHAQAKKAAVASLCANEQKKFFEYTHILWDNQKSLDVASLKKYAADLKLDTTKFDQCLDSDKTLAQVTKDTQDGAKAGVTGTPSFFINGQMLTGAQPYDAFKKVIDDELREAKRKK